MRLLMQLTINDYNLYINYGGSISNILINKKQQMKKGTLTGLFETTGTYISMTPAEKKAEQKKNKPKNKTNEKR